MEKKVPVQQSNPYKYWGPHKYWGKANIHLVQEIVIAFFYYHPDIHDFEYVLKRINPDRIVDWIEVIESPKFRKILEDGKKRVQGEENFYTKMVMEIETAIALLDIVGR